MEELCSQFLVNTYGLHRISYSAYCARTDGVSYNRAPLAFRPFAVSMLPQHIHNLAEQLVHEIDPLFEETITHMHYFYIFRGPSGAVVFAMCP